MKTAAVTRPAANPGDTRQLILRAARELIQTRSYLGLSFQELADRVGIRKASLYHHFESKEALGIAVIERASEVFEQWISHHASQSPQARLLAYIGMLRDRVGAGERMCPGGAMGPGWDCIEPGLQDAVRGMAKQHLNWLTHTIAEMPAALSPASLTPAQQAAHFYATGQGALFLARIAHDVAQFDQATAALTAPLMSS